MNWLTDIFVCTICFASCVTSDPWKVCEFVFAVAESCLPFCVGVKLGLTIRDEQRPRGFENRTLEEWSTSKLVKIAQWEVLWFVLHAKHYWGEQVRDYMGRKYVGEKRNAYEVLVGTAAGMKPLTIPRHRWENNFKMDFQITSTWSKSYFCTVTKHN